MKFKFNVNITQEDYIEFNKIVMTETPVGKKSNKIWGINRPSRYLGGRFM